MVDVETREEQEVRRGSGGRFAPGSSGNPAGRPRGSRNRTTQLCADLLSADAEAIMDKLVKMAKKGDGIALRLAVERLLPVRAARDRAVDFELPDVGKAVDLVAAAGAVIARAAAGEITLSEAREFMALLSAERALIETADLAVRIEALEGEQARQLGEAAIPPELKARVRFIESKVGEVQR